MLSTSRCFSLLCGLGNAKLKGHCNGAGKRSCINARLCFFVCGISAAKINVVAPLVSHVLARLLFSENVLSQLGVVLQTFEAFDARSPTGSAQTMPSSAACSASSAAAQQSGVSARGCVFYMSNDDQAQVHKLVTRELGVVKTPKSVQASIDAISRSPPKGRVEVR